MAGSSTSLPSVAPPRMTNRASLQRAFLTVNLDQNGAEAGAGAVGVYGDQVLVVIRSDLQLPAVTLGVAAGHGLVAFIVVPLTVRAMVSAGAAAIEHVAELLQFVEIEDLHLVRRVRGDIFGGDDFQAEAHGPDVDVGSVLVATRLGPGRGAGVNRNAVVG